MRAAGFVLAGGRSSRMGRDKALLEIDGETLVARAVGSLKEVCAEVAIAGGGAELARFARVVPDVAPGCGPLGGIVSALAETPFQWNLFLAVDVPFVPKEVWRRLLGQAENSGAAAVMARVGEQVHPLCAAYSRRALRVLREELDAGRWKVADAVGAAGFIDYADFDVPEWFRNVNTPEDLALLAALPADL